MIIHYEINKEKITQLYCINKSKPILTCNGKCYLNAELTKQQENKDQSPIVDIQKNIQLFLDNIIKKSIVIPITDYSELFSFYLLRLPQSYLEVPFQPPKK